MWQSTITYVGILAAGVVGGFAAGEMRGESENDYLDQIAREQCDLRKGIRAATAIKQRTTSLPDAPPVPGVTDWILWVYCEGAPAPQIRVYNSVGD